MVTTKPQPAEDEHVYVDDVHWIEFCPKCIADFDTLAREYPTEQERWIS